MSDAIKYHFGAIDAAAEDIRMTSGKINGILEDVKSSIRPMVAEWEGESATAYQAAQQQWDSSAAEINMILSSIASTVSEGNSRMGDVNRRAAASWS